MNDKRAAPPPEDREQKTEAKVLHSFEPSTQQRSRNIHCLLYTSDAADE